jgi:hypothetical protein
MVALSVGGIVILRRRRIPVLPLLAVGLEVILAVTLSFGNTRYRTPFEVSLALLSAVTLDWIWCRTRRRQDDSGVAAEPGAPAPFTGRDDSEASTAGVPAPVGLSTPYG